MRKDEETLGKAIEAIRNEQIPPRPPQQLVDATVAKLAETQGQSDTLPFSNEIGLLERLGPLKGIMRFAAAAALFIVAGYAAGRASAPRAPDMEQLQIALESAIRRNVVTQLRDDLQLGLATCYERLSDELGAQQRQDMARFATQILTASSSVTNKVLAELIESIDTAQRQERQRFAAAMEQIEPKDLLTINEDMNVMSRIFENNLQEARIAPAGGGLFLPSSRDALITLLGRGGGAIQGMYLQGYGALFLMKVDFPLSAPPQTPQKEETDDQGKTDEVWEQMRQQIYEPQRVARNKTAAESEQYDPQKVENLRTTLVKSLKHSANIRNLRPDESVVILITGSGDFAGETMITTRRTIVVNGHRGIIQEPASDAAGSPTIIVIRAKKADIDGFAKGDLDLDQFRQRVQMLSYSLLGGTAASEDAADAARDTLLGLRRRSVQ